MTNAQIADLLDHAADAAAATDGNARSAIWRIARTVTAAIEATAAYEGWLRAGARRTDLTWIAGPSHELGVRALRTCAAWLRGDQEEGRDTSSTPTSKGAV